MHLLDRWLSSRRAQLRKVVCPIDEVCKCVPTGVSVFDLGCGTGAMLLEVIKTRNVSVVGGSEIFPSLLEVASSSVARELGVAGNFIEATMPPACLSEFDCVTLIDVLHHIPKQEQAAYLTEMAANMKSGARLVLKDIDASSPLVWFNRLHDAVFAGNGFQEVGIGEAERMVADSGLVLENTRRMRKLWYPHYFIIARKP
jgi:2-polyprenyl-3-methyl-5-hydroxy-6-metoxy-1,4-benzoquinol methylase